MADTILFSKVCTKCGVEKTLDNFSKGKSATNPHRAGCKACAYLGLKKWREQNPEKQRAALARYRAAHSEQISKLKKDWARRNFERLKANRTNYYATNKLSILEKNRVWADCNPERIKAHGVAWRERNKSKVKNNTSAYRSRNLQAYRVYQQNRRALKSSGKLSANLFERLFELQKGRCPCCKRPLGKDAHLDHKMPLALGGTNTDENMQLLRATCNLKKSAAHPIDYMQSKGFLL